MGRGVVSWGIKMRGNVITHWFIAGQNIIPATSASKVSAENILGTDISRKSIWRGHIIVPNCTNTYSRKCDLDKNMNNVHPSSTHFPHENRNTNYWDIPQDFCDLLDILQSTPGIHSETTRRTMVDGSLETSAVSNPTASVAPRGNSIGTLTHQSKTHYNKPTLHT